MTVVKFDTRGVDRSKNQRPSDIPSIGLHRAKISECDFKTQKGKNAQLVVVYRIDEPGRKSNGYPLWSYIDWVLDSVQWKKDQFLEAIGISKQTGSFDTAKQVGKPIMVRVRHEEWNGSMRAKPNGVWLVTEEDDEDLPGEEDYDPDEDEEDEDEDEELEEEEDEEDLEDEEDEEEEPEDEEEEPEPVAKKTTRVTKAQAKSAVASGRKKAAAPVEEVEDEYEDEAAFPVAKLRDELQGRDLSPKGPRSALIARLRANDADPFSD